MDCEKVKRDRRGKLCIIENMLQSLKGESQIKTHIAYNSKLHPRTIAKYLPLLVELHLVTKSTLNTYKITSKGVLFLRDYSKLNKYGSI